MSLNVEQLIQEIQLLPHEQRQQLAKALNEHIKKPATAPETEDSQEEVFKRRLFELGLIKEIKRPARDQEAFERYTPIPIQGKPLSESIIEERR